MKFVVVAMFIAFYAAFGVESKSVEERSKKATGNRYNGFLEAAGRLILSERQPVDIPNFRG